MKKLTTPFIILFVCVSGLFANPKIPKTNSYIISDDNYSNESIYTYVNNSCQNVYRIFSIVNDNEKTLFFQNESYITGIKIHINIHFSSENSLDSFVKNFNTSNLENDFISLRQFFIESDITPIITLDADNKIQTVLYIGEFN